MSLNKIKEYWHGRVIHLVLLTVKELQILGMKTVRIIARLDIKGAKLIKGVQLEGLRVIGDPNEYALKYYCEGIDEIIFMDTVASLYGRNNLQEIVRYTAQKVFVPLTVGGGIRSVEDVRDILLNGADKVAVNTAALKRPALLREIAETFGSQCLVLSIEAKRQADGKWEAFMDNGREHSGMDVYEWAHMGMYLGAGEIFLTSVDMDGTCKGFDVDLVKRIASSLSIPVIVSGGMGKLEHLLDVIREGEADAVAIANVLHYNKLSISEIKHAMQYEGIPVRVTK
jgi:cyclase